MTLPYPSIGTSFNGPGLSPVELQAVAYMGLHVVNARRRGERDFDVEIDYLDQTRRGDIGWLPLILLHHEWKRRSLEIASLVQEAGGPSAEKCAADWMYVMDLDDQDTWYGMAVVAWALIVARRST